MKAVGKLATFFGLFQQTTSVLRFSALQRGHEAGEGGVLGERCAGLAFVPSRLAYWVF